MFLYLGYHVLILFTFLVMIMEGVFQLSIGFVLVLLVLAYMVFLKRLRSLGRPSVEFRDLVYNKAAGQLELHVENKCGRPVYVSPSLRLIHFLDPEEWRGKKSNGGSGGEMLDGRCYCVDSVIKGYTLIGESPGVVMVEGNSVKKIVYPLGDVRLSLCDNIRVDSQCGFNGASDDMVVDTLRVSVKDGHEGLDCLILDPVSPDRFESNRLFDTITSESAKPVFNYISSGVSSGFEAPAYNPNFCVVPPVTGDKPTHAVENVFPLQAVCVCCGKEKWLEWVVGGNYVCAGCKDFLEGDVSRGQVPESGVVVDVNAVSNGVSGGDSSLKPRHAEIMSLLEHENNLTVRKISRLLSVNDSTVASDLKYLMERDMVGRVQVGRRYLYHLA